MTSHTTPMNANTDGQGRANFNPAGPRVFTGFRHLAAGLAQLGRPGLPSRSLPSPIPGFASPNRSSSGFTLAELLIALAILGVIATFTIPKVLQSQQDTKWKSIAKEAAASLANAYGAYRLENGRNPDMTTLALTPYLNYVKKDTTSTVDYHPTDGTRDCGQFNRTCLLLHNGAILYMWDIDRFGGSASTNAIYYLLDPDGKSAGGNVGKAVQFWLYYDGKIRTKGTIADNSCWRSGGSDSCTSANISHDPGWFSWD